MRIPFLAAFPVAAAISLSAAFSEQPSPTPSASGSAAPAVTAKPSPSASPAAKNGDAKPSASTTPIPTLREKVDGLSQTDLNDALNLLKANYLDPSALEEKELTRATLQGLINRLSPGISILEKAPAPPASSPFRAEVLEDSIGYLRLGSLSSDNVAAMDAALQNFNGKGLKSAILDLRATPAGSDFDIAAEVIKRFCPKGKELFTVKKTRAKQERIITSDRDPIFQGLLVVLADSDTAGAAEVIAAVLRADDKAMLVGSNTAGEAVEYSDLPLPDGKILRVAVAEVTLPGGSSLFSKGVKPDIAVEVSAVVKHQVMPRELEKEGVAPLISETERAHMNEAALVAHTNPEIDALQAAQHSKGERSKPPQLHDTVLEHAIDFITALEIYQTRPPAN